MKLRQLHFVHEIVKHDLSITAAAEALFTSQPGISKQLRLLEDELGVPLFERSGKHLTRLTPAGEQIVQIVDRVLLDVDNISRVAKDFSDGNRGVLSLATTHTQARYALPPAVTAFKKQYPDVTLNLHQGSPPQIARMAAEGEADFAIATEALHHFDELVMLPCYHWNRALLLRPGHPLASVSNPGLKDLARYPLITYTFGFTGRSQLDQAFKAQGLQPNVVLTAVDADVIKTYVRLGLGVGIIANMAYSAEEDDDLVAIDAGHLFSRSTTHIGFRRNQFLRDFMVRFIETFAPHLKRDLIEQVIEIREPAERRAFVAEHVGEVPAL
ncbi:HTH-type transcriptional regulator CysB [Abyssibacter profundi]|uniref:HTH-type transcriptional regulator CysB n=1 Tax=Abyssibacter profundi TaxID=2182787 RepID=A0A363UK56_9GAMM|nr:HTH-type transcriptional regulator CysB [Abyssibacter profundi]PWN55809.1 HTH-type transcriptional regulator CysB [Abyssibacter profundi]